MRKRGNIQGKIWFGRWSRKGWAIFRSLHAVVHIMHMKVSMCYQSGLKQSSKILHTLYSDGAPEKGSVLDLLVALLAPPENYGEEILQNIIFQEIKHDLAAQAVRCDDIVTYQSCRWHI